MRREFKENEESKKMLENNLDMQDEIDDGTFRRILREEFIEREKQVTEALFADEELENLEVPDAKIHASYQELLRRYEKEKKGNMEASAELVPDESLLHDEVSKRKRVISMEEARERRKKVEEAGSYRDIEPKNAKAKARMVGGGLHRFGKVVGMAAVCVACVFAASMTSEANRKYLVNSVRIWSGDDTKTVVDNDEGNEKSNISENKAVAEIEEQLGIEIPEFYYRPYGFIFKNYELKETLEIARMEYEYENNIITLYIDKQNESSESKMNSMHGDEKGVTILSGDGVSVLVSKIEDEGEKDNYSAEWKKDSVIYCLSGRINFEDLEKIIEKMKF